MNELDDILDELEDKVYVVVAFGEYDDHNRRKIKTVSPRMTIQEAREYWNRTGLHTDHIAHYKTPLKDISIVELVHLLKLEAAPCPDL